MLFRKNEEQKKKKNTKNAWTTEARTKIAWLIGPESNSEEKAHMATVLFALHQMTKTPALWHPVSVAWQELGDCGDLPKWVALPSDSLGNSSRVNSKKTPVFTGNCGISLHVSG